MAFFQFLASVRFSSLSSFLQPLVVFSVAVAICSIVRVIYIRFIVSIPLPSSEEFEALGVELVAAKRGDQFRLRNFEAYFGAEPEVVSTIWRELFASGWLFRAGIHGPDPVHILWTLLSLKRYGVGSLLVAVAGVREKTFSSWAWFYAEGIAKLDSRVLRKRVTMRGVTTSSLKFQTTGGKDLHYRIDICNLTNEIVSFAGPFVGRNADLPVMNDYAVTAVKDDLMKWDILGSPYHHDVNKHHFAFRSVIVIREFQMERDRKSP